VWRHVKVVEMIARRASSEAPVGNDGQALRGSRQSTVVGAGIA
jgi:hypothetical protein